MHRQPYDDEYDIIINDEDQKRLAHGKGLMVLHFVIHQLAGVPDPDYREEPYETRTQDKETDWLLDQIEIIEKRLAVLRS